MDVYACNVMFSSLNFQMIKVFMGVFIPAQVIKYGYWHGVPYLIFKFMHDKWSLLLTKFYWPRRTAEDN